MVPHITQLTFYTAVTCANASPSFFWVINALWHEHADGAAGIALAANLVIVPYAKAQGAVQPGVVNHSSG
jgi:predicted outer membrane lipoprotein